MKETITWHHGLVARWWAEFNQGGEDVATFVGLALAQGGSVLDAGCGTGRILLPLLEAGLEADGADASNDMLDWCRQSLDAAGLRAHLTAQPMHLLDLPRRYRTAIVCGAFGLGGSRADDLEGLRRLRGLLVPGGRLFMDHYLPNREHPKAWHAWVEQPALPRPWPAHGKRRRAADGSELELKTRQLEFDPLAQTTTLEIRVSRYEDTQVIEQETHAIQINLYFLPEVRLMLESAGFRQVTVRAFTAQRPPEPWRDDRLLFEARA